MLKKYGKKSDQAPALRAASQAEFEEFRATASISPPQQLSQNLFQTIHSHLNPSLSTTLLKLFGIHTLIGLVTLAACPQFGVKILPFDGLFSLFSSLGSHGCMMACGAFFLGSSALVATILLQPEESRLLRRHSWAYLLSLSILSLAVFYGLGAEIFFAISIPWVLGALIGGRLTWELGWKLRLYRYGME